MTASSTIRFANLTFCGNHGCTADNAFHGHIDPAYCKDEAAHAAWELAMGGGGFASIAAMTRDESVPEAAQASVPLRRRLQIRWWALLDRIAG